MTIATALNEPLLNPSKTIANVNEDICRPLERFPSKAWWVVFILSLGCLLLGTGLVAIQFKEGIGVLGINHPVGWGVYITNFVFWIGIGHAGTLISAILFLFRQKWRTSINRSAEAMTIFAVMTAGIFPLIHTGRPWLAFWLFPYPNDRGSLWVNFRSPLLWDVFAVSTYFTISLIFWYVGLVPDLASVRDRAKNRIRKFIYNILSLGWKGSQRNWNHYESAYLIFAGISTPLVLSVHSIVSFDFAVSLMPGWHTTIFPPYFVAGAIFSGFAMVLTLLVIVRRAFHLEDYITPVHLDNMNKIILATSLMVGYAYGVEFFTAWYSGNLYEFFAFKNRALGPFAWSYWTMICSNVIAPQFFWFKRFRRSIPVMFILSLIINVGMWYERFTIIVTSLHRDFLPSNWDYYTPTKFDWGVTLGSFGFFFTLFLLFCRVLPTIAMAEIKSTIHTGKQTPETEEFVF